jgi:hypothetical protein
MALRERACPKTKGRPSGVQRSTSQVPGEEARDTDDESFPVRRTRVEQWFRRRLHMAVTHELPVVLQDAGVQGADVEVKATIKCMRLGGEAPEVSSS